MLPVALTVWLENRLFARTLPFTSSVVVGELLLIATLALAIDKDRPSLSRTLDKICPFT
jgi:hypothetical protein